MGFEEVGRMRPIPCLLAALIAASLPAGVQADAEADARAAFQKGVAEFDAGSYQEAVGSFREANRLSPSWKIFYNIGQCEAALKRYGDALDAFDQYLAEGGDEIPPEREAEVLAEVARLRLKVGTVEVRGEAGLTVVIDGNERGVTPVDAGIRVAGGVPHALTLRRGDAVVIEREFKVGNGQQVVIEVPSAASDGAPAPAGEAGGPGGAAPEESGGRASPLFISGLVVGVAGVGLLAVGGGFYGKGKGDYDDYKAAGAGGDAAEYDRLKNDALPLDNAMIATGFIAGGVLTALGATLLIVDAVKKDEKPAAVAVGPAPGGLRVSF
jgi:hypothetical protein